MGNKIDNGLLFGLAESTPKEEIKHRQSGGGLIDYVDARFCMDRLDEVVGPANWKREHKTIDGLMFCGVSILIGEEWVTKWDVGTESTFEKEKGLVSDSFKRACVNWGIARDLYSNKRRDSQVTSPRAGALGTRGSSQPEAQSSISTNGELSTPSYTQVLTKVKKTWDGQDCITFGKYYENGKGEKWCNIPADYLLWIKNKMKDPARALAVDELKRRKEEATQASNVN